jgi:phosphoglucosamine mutase
MRLFGSSGIRAVYDRDLLALAFRAGLAVGRQYHDVVVGQDTRTSGDTMKHAVISGLRAAGARCSDIGIAPTPTLAYVTRKFTAGVMVTASHNPSEYNGLKFLNPDGSSFGLSQQEQMENAILAESFETVRWEKMENCLPYEGAIVRHIEGIMDGFNHKVKVKVVVDAGGGAGSVITPRLLEKLGCEIITLNCQYTGSFPRGSEPAEANLAELCRLVRESGAAVGIAHDGDADRMMAIDERGRYISGDKLLVILARAAEAKEVVTTLDASMAIETMGFDVRRTRIGDTFVSEELRKGGDFGGETSGAWIFPALSLCPDGIHAAAQIAAIAGHHNLSELADAIPAYPLHRGSIDSYGVVKTRLESNLKVLKAKSITNTDGLRLDFGDGWLLVRPSGTEPKIRLTAEAKTVARTEQLYDAGLKAIKESVETGGRKN